MRTFALSLALVSGLGLGLLLPEVKAQTAPPPSVLCIGFEASGQASGKVAEITQEWMTQQLGSNRSRFVTAATGKGVVLCSW